MQPLVMGSLPCSGAGSHALEPVEGKGKSAYRKLQLDFFLLIADNVESPSHIRDRTSHAACEEIRRTSSD